MKKTAIILAGGFGTRLKKRLPDLPKPMAPINDRPFLAYLLKKLSQSGFTDCILSVGYKYEIIQDYFDSKYLGLELTYVIEDEPLGTGGAILKSLEKVQSPDIYILNGDTFFDIDFDKLSLSHIQNYSKLSVAVKKIEDARRYGFVMLDSEFRIAGFTEKGNAKDGFINGGIYLADTAYIKGLNLPQKFSFEKSVLEEEYLNSHFQGVPFDSYFIDIGIPEDYQKAMNDLE